MKESIIYPQTSDMGNGHGIYEFDHSTTLEEFLEYFADTTND